ncbi:MAG: hypothetical protein IPH93_08615 [Saprospiraceae bacterium]|nr:hypothetical protein [Saprospiraceae bacterium]MBK7810559.1 hypothetical protein [Saprospiraceae bacterium]
MKKIAILILVNLLLYSICFQTGFTQTKWTIHSSTISFFNASTMMPGTGKYLITTNVIHPGFNLGVSLAIKENKYNLWLTKLRVGYFHHRLSQQALQLFGEMAYRYKLFNDHLGLEAGIAGGYLHAFSDIQVFNQKPDGTYTYNEGYSRPQVMFGIGLSPSYLVYSTDKTKIRIFAEYQFLLQAPFVKSYVPILPYNMLHIGLNLQRLKA